MLSEYLLKGNKHFIKDNNLCLNQNHYILNLFGEDFENIYDDFTSKINSTCIGQVKFIEKYPSFGEVLWQTGVVSVGVKDGDSFNYTALCSTVAILVEKAHTLTVKPTFVIPTNQELYGTLYNLQIISEILCYFLEDFDVIFYQRQHNRKSNWVELKPTVYGWGINDVVEQVKITQFIGKVDGKNTYKDVWVCPYYADWKHMIERCYCSKYQEKSPSYKEAFICEDWKYFSNFIKWVDSQPNRDWQNCDLDKDLLVDGNKIYSTETCMYVDSATNRFILRGKRSNETIIGVTKYKSTFRSSCNNPLQENNHYLGYFSTELEAHLAWQAKKHEYACQLADLQQDPRVAKALRERYAPDKDWTNR